MEQTTLAEQSQQPEEPTTEEQSQQEQQQAGRRGGGEASSADRPDMTNGSHSQSLPAGRPYRPMPHDRTFGDFMKAARRGGTCNQQRKEMRLKRREEEQERRAAAAAAASAEDAAEEPPARGEEGEVEDAQSQNGVTEEAAARADEQAGEGEGEEDGERTAESRGEAEGEGEGEAAEDITSPLDDSTGISAPAAAGDISHFPAPTVQPSKSSTVPPPAPAAPTPPAAPLSPPPVRAKEDETGGPPLPASSASQPDDTRQPDGPVTPNTDRDAAHQPPHHHQHHHRGSPPPRRGRGGRPPPGSHWRPVREGGDDSPRQADREEPSSGGYGHVKRGTGRGGGEASSADRPDMTNGSHSQSLPAGRPYRPMPHDRTFGDFMKAARRGGTCNQQRKEMRLKRREEEQERRAAAAAAASAEDAAEEPQGSTAQSQHGVTAPTMTQMPTEKAAPLSPPAVQAKDTNTTQEGAVVVDGKGGAAAPAAAGALAGPWWGALGRVVEWFFPAPVPSPSNDMLTYEWMGARVRGRK
ncbi:unnamed protein product [Vitrella brassicaformis CCMP3155]|uniref:Uncharacterized protein n=1 Tax=Vitrella brassicaformis (strain CCMP3155) TaxID=1169540 RepID=A0A0G4FKV9_VITBC|nr:unnamed protein product [Vitrella brassicaformis CCMP3155]|eukprot:CEM14010.1 unnamed protein product [Vitrella brassicaformis CCMP3155]